MNGREDGSSGLVRARTAALVFGGDLVHGYVPYAWRDLQETLMCPISADAHHRGQPKNKT